MLLPLPTFKNIFTLTLLGSSVLLQTSGRSEYHPFAQSQVVSALSLYIRNCFRWPSEEEIGKEYLLNIVPRVPQATQSVKGPTWTELTKTN